MSTNSEFSRQKPVDSSQRSDRFPPTARGNDDRESAASGMARLGGAVKRGLIDTASEIGAWLAPLPSAVSVANAAHRNLHYDPWLAFVVGAIVELLGFATTNRAADLWEYNQTRRDDEPKAPFWLAAALVVMYIVSTIALSVISDLSSDVVHLLPAIFPIMALTGTVNVALGRQHARRVERNRMAERQRRIDAEIAEEERKAEAERRRQERKAEREARRQATVKEQSIDGSIDGLVDRLQAGRAAKKASIIDAMLDAYRVNPLVGDTELGGLVGVTRQTIYNYKRELEQAGRVHINGNGVEVR